MTSRGYTPRPKVPSTCVVCGKVTLGRANRKYCGKQCTYAASFPGKLSKCEQCETCGADISHKQRGARYCSRECIHKDQYVPRQRQERKTRKIKCDECGKEVDTKGNTTKFCGKLCSDRFYYRENGGKERMREYQRKRSAKDGIGSGKRYGEIKPCQLCLTEFHGTKRAKFCSNTCSNLGRSGWTSDTIDWDAFYSGKEQRRAYISQTIRQKVYRRDKYICQICGDACVGTSGRQPLSPSLDHIVPWSLSQDDSEDNLRTAHLLCNMQRGAGVV